MRVLALLLMLVVAPVFGATNEELAELAKRAAAGQSQARGALEKLSRDGDAGAALLLGMLYLSGRGVPQSEARAIEQFSIGAFKGRVDAAHNLAVTYQRAPDKLRNLEAARTWYRSAAERGFARSQSNLGEMLLEGSGGPADIDAARGWIEKAAAQDEPRGLYLLGILQLEGRAGLQKDPEAAARLPQRAAAGQDRDAEYRLALLYGTGQGVEKDEQAAFRLLVEAAAQRLPKAEYRMATIYGRGAFGVQKDEAAAAKWLRLAARQGHLEAGYSLGLMYAEGRGAKADSSEVYGWMLDAARKGHPRAIEYVQRIQANRAKAAPAPPTGEAQK